MFVELYETARDSDNFFDLEKKLSSKLYQLDLPMKYYGSLINITPAAQLVLNKYTQKAEWLRTLGASVHKIAQAYAIMNDLYNVEVYYTQYKADPTAIAVGFALRGNVGEALRYVSEHHADVGQVAYALAFRGDDNEITQLIKAHGESIINSIAQGYASRNKHKATTKVNDYINQYPHVINLKQIAAAYAVAGNDVEVERYRTEYGVDVTAIACFYAAVGSHNQVQNYRQEGADVNQIASVCAITYQYDWVETYHLHHNADVNQITGAFALAGNYPAMEHYRTQFNVSLKFIDQVFDSSSRSVEPRKKYLIYLLDNYLTHRKADINSSRRPKDYLHSRFFIFQKSLTQKDQAVSALKKVLNGHPDDLQEHLSTLRNGRLGETLREFIKSGLGNAIAGREVNTVTDFIQALSAPSLHGFYEI